MQLGKVKYGLDKKLEEEANRLLRENVGENKRGINRDVEKMRHEVGDVSEAFHYYDPRNNWDTQDSAFMIDVQPKSIEYIEPSICANTDDGNVRARNSKLLERSKLMRHVGDDDSWGSTREDIPPLGVNNGPRKTCTKCTQSKGLQYFSSDSRNRDGLRSWCKECERESSKERYTRKSKGKSRK